MARLQPVGEGPSALIREECRILRDRLDTALATAPPVIDSTTATATAAAAAAAAELNVKYHRRVAQLAVIGPQRALGTGIEAKRRLLAVNPWVVVIVSGSPDDDVCTITITITTAAAVCRARAFLRRDVTKPEIFTVLADIPRGTAALDAWPSTVEIGPSARAPQVLPGMSQGQSNADISAALALPGHTVKTPVRRMSHKLSVCDRAQAVAVGTRRGCLPDPPSEQPSRVVTLLHSRAGPATNRARR